MLSSSFKLFSQKNIGQNRVNFTISSNNSINDIVLDGKENEAFVYWYIGSHGLKQGSIDFYREYLTRNIIHGSIPFIVDLTAWGAFTKNCSITRYHESSASLDCEKLKTLTCSKVFEELQKISSENKIFSLIKEITKRENLLGPSELFDKVDLKLKDIFNNNCPVIEEIYDLDCAKSYSVIQYIEFLFLVDMILSKKTGINSIKFVLPNDEAKYYLPSMEDDLKKFLTARGHQFKELNIQIQCFNYGEQICHRPYNCPSKTIPGRKKLELSNVIDAYALDNSIKFRNL